jgi:hypothetical protein
MSATKFHTHTFIFGKAKKNGILEDLWNRWKDNIKTNLKPKIKRVWTESVSSSSRLGPVVDCSKQVNALSDSTQAR